jgi:two-component system, response regulator
MRTPPTRILIVEDNADDEFLLMRQLQKADLHTQVKVIADGGQALAYLTDEGQACENLIAIFLDLQLPTLPGLQLLKAIRALKRTMHLPVVVMTSSKDPKQIAECRALGISAFVDKPVTFSAFTNALADTFHAREIASAGIKP